MLSMIKIDLSILTKNKVRMLTGHVRGVESRNMYKLDLLEAEGEPIVLTAPDNLEAITPSFVQGFLGDAVTRLGSSAVEALYDLSQLPLFLRDDFQVGIERLKLHAIARSRGN